jgi:hypothetical protein
VRFDDPQRVPHADAPPPDEHAPRPDDAALRAVVSRLARPHRSGGHVVERAALMADGTDFSALLGWIEAHDGVPEPLPPSAPDARGAGLFGDRRLQHPRRFVLPPTTFA